ncbi:hypothetical protein B0E51_15815 [Rhodanobacter sp. C05]|nr:hypothetical protein B0E51_15815 [Rhodanobacter sp. C05]
MYFPPFFYGYSHPITHAVVICLIGLIFVLTRHRRIGLGIVTLGALWVTFCAMPVFVDHLQRGLEDQYAIKPASTYPNEGAIVVLGGDIPPHENSDWNDDTNITAATRAGFGYLLFRAQRAPLVLLSAGDGGAQDMARMLEQQGVPSTALLIEDRSKTTYENALYSAAILRHQGIQRILLVTSALHMPRAVASFRKQGMDVVPAPAFSSQLNSPFRDNHRWRPQRAELWRCSHILHEYLGLWIYKLRGLA